MRHTPDGGLSETGLARFEVGGESLSSGRFSPADERRPRWPPALRCLPLGLVVVALLLPPRVRAGDGVAERVLSEPMCTPLEAGDEDPGVPDEDPGGLPDGAGCANAGQPPAARAVRSLTAVASDQRRRRASGVRASQMPSSRAERLSAGSSQVMPTGMGSSTSSASSAGGPAIGAHRTSSSDS